MVFKNIQIYNTAELVTYDDGSISWLRVPKSVYENLERDGGRTQARGSTGVELRFVLNSDQAVIKMSTTEDTGLFHIYRGGIQGGWEDHEVDKFVDTNIREYVIKRSKNMNHLKIMHEKAGHDWAPEVVRIIFDRGAFRIYDIQGDISLPTPEQYPKSTLLCYGSSITHGSNSIDTSHSWPALLGYRLNMDVRNLGMAGSCCMEPEMVDYIASEGEKGYYSAAVLELGINVLSWDSDKARARVSNTIQQIAGRNPDKPIWVISPFYHCGDDFSPAQNAKRWRKLIQDTVKSLNYPNVTYVNGLDMIGDMSFMSADEVHPNIYGVQQIADRLTAILKPILCR